MLLLEIFDKDHDESWSKKLDVLIGKHGLAAFSGNNARVIADDKRPYVYRVWVNDSGYESWIKEAEKLQSNEHIVKILSPIRIVAGRYKRLPKDAKIKFVKLEKLSALTDGSAECDLIDMIDHILQNVSFKERAHIDVEEMIERLGEAAEKTTGDEAEAAKIKETAEKHRSFLKVLLTLATKHMWSDWNSDNIMLRGKTLVIVDPAQS